jgi:hypothetical protein
MCSLRLLARKCSQGMPELSLAFFEAEIKRARVHVAHMRMSPVASCSRSMSRRLCLTAGSDR